METEWHVPAHVHGRATSHSMGQTADTAVVVMGRGNTLRYRHVSRAGRFQGAARLCYLYGMREPMTSVRDSSGGRVTVNMRGHLLEVQASFLRDAVTVPPCGPRVFHRPEKNVFRELNIREEWVGNVNWDLLLRMAFDEPLHRHHLQFLKNPTRSTGEAFLRVVGRRTRVVLLRKRVTRGYEYRAVQWRTPAKGEQVRINGTDITGDVLTVTKDICTVGTKIGTYKVHGGALETLHTVQL